MQDLERFLEERFTRGSLFEEKYRIDRLIGTGNFAHVILARHESMDRDVALKILKPDMVKANPSLSERFMNEVRVVSQLQHPNVVTIFDFGHTADKLDYMVLEHIAGVPLDEVLQDTDSMSLDRTTNIAFQILSALGHAHRKGIIHRDLKPSNVMLATSHEDEDVVKVLDFGVAKFVDNDDSKETDSLGKRKSTRFIGTPIYMSPEQVLGEEVVPASDFYSLGLILYEMYTGGPPILATNVGAVARLHISEEPLPLERIGELPEKIQRVIRVATDRYPSQRYQTADEFVRALSAATGVDSEYSDPEWAAGDKTRTESKPSPKPDASLDEASSNATDFFLKQSGAFVVQEFDDDDDDTLTRKKRAAREMRKATPPRRQHRPSARDSGELELDIDRVRKVDRAHRSRPARRPTESRSESSSYSYSFGEIIGIGAGVVLTVWSIYLAGAFAAPIAGLLPPVCAMLWTMSVEFGSHSTRSFSERWVVPTAKHAIYLFIGIVVAAFVGFPEHAVASIESPTWFGQSLGLISGVEHIKPLFLSLFQVGEHVIPW